MYDHDNDCPSVLYNKSQNKYIRKYVKVYNLCCKKFFPVSIVIYIFF